MRVAFVHAECSYSPSEIPLQRALAERMIDSVRKRMNCQVVQLTDPITPPLDVDAVERHDPRGKHWMSFVLGIIRVQPPETLYIDTDCVVQEDVSWVFENEFDVAMTFKNGKCPAYKDKNGVNYPMPINGGVAFLRRPEFWDEVLRRVELIEEPIMRVWWGSQIIEYRLVKEGKFKVLLLDANRFNYSPDSPDEDLSGKAVIHYKGAKRKTWNLDGGWEPLPDGVREIAVFK